MSAFYAVRVTLTDVNSGTTVTRDYVRGPMRIGRAAFQSFALGDLLRLTHLGHVFEDWTEDRKVSWDLWEITESDVH